MRDGEDDSGIDEKLVIETLRAIPIKVEHIDELIDLVPGASSNQLKLVLVKIQLFESKKDYVEAFMLHINSEPLKKIVFKWL